MKPKTMLLALVVLFSSFSYAKGPDDQAVPFNQLQLQPDPDVLYFNQMLDFTLPESSPYTIDHIEAKFCWAEVSPKGFKLDVIYANIPEASDELKVFVRDASGNVTLAYHKTISLKQKLSEKGFESVGNDNNIFKLDDEIVTLKNTASKEKLLNAHRFDINTERYDEDSIRLKSFDVQIKTASGVKQFHSSTGEITDEMKAAIKDLTDGDTVTFVNIMTEYMTNNQWVNLNFNYTVRYVVGSVG